LPAADAAAQRLTAAVARGDRAALAEFYESWFDRAYLLARSITRRDESFCLDVVQEGMLRVVRSVRPMGSHGDLERWMARVIHTAALDLLRRETRRARRERRRVVPLTDAAAVAVDADQVAWLRERLRELPPEDGQLLAARFVADRSLDEAGAAAGMSGDAAHGRIRRALNRLRSWAKEDDHD
jgi:RNA polymerase sigma factor (sigma-70 family)